LQRLALGGVLFVGCYEALQSARIEAAMQAVQAEYAAGLAHLGRQTSES
jgi:hypothetical protein